jgi:hypothetical protein
METLHVISEWIEHHPGLAAWLQAIGSLVAIGIAIWVPARYHKLARSAAATEHKLRTRTLVNLLGPALWEFRAAIDDVIRVLGAPHPANSPNARLQLLHDTQVALPPFLLRDMNEFSLFGDGEGPTLVALIAAVEEYDRAWRSQAGEGALDIDSIYTELAPRAAELKKRYAPALQSLKKLTMTELS